MSELAMLGVMRLADRAPRDPGTMLADLLAALGLPDNAKPDDISAAVTALLVEIDDGSTAEDPTGEGADPPPPAELRGDPRGFTPAQQKQWLVARAAKRVARKDPLLAVRAGRVAQLRQLKGTLPARLGAATGGDRVIKTSRGDVTVTAREIKNCEEMGANLEDYARNKATRDAARRVARR